MVGLSSNNTRNVTLLALTWPIFVELSLYMLMGNVDTLMLSRYSDEAVAAVGVVNQLMNMVNLIFGFVAMGTTILVSRYLGENRDEDASQVAVTSMGLNLVFGVLMSVVLVSFGSTFLRWLGLEASLMRYALEFQTVTGGFMFVQALLLTASAVAKSHGFTKKVMLITFAMNVTNIVGNYLFLFEPFGLPSLGVTGVAISTAASRAIGLCAMLFLFFGLLHRRPRWREFLLPARRHVRDLLRIGVPAAGEQLSHNASQLLITSFIAMIGVTAMVTRAYTFQIVFFITVFTMAISQGTQILIARSIGAGDPEGAYRRGLRSLWLGIGLCLAVAAIFNSIGGILLGMFTDDPAVLTLGRQLLLFAFLLEPGRAFNLIVIGSLRAVGDVKFPVFACALITWGVAVPTSYLLGIELGLGLTGIFLAFILDEWIRGLLMLRRWTSRRWMGREKVKSLGVCPDPSVIDAS